jgi:hypothetical protein
MTQVGLKLAVRRDRTTKERRVMKRIVVALLAMCAFGGVAHADGTTYCKDARVQVWNTDEFGNTKAEPDKKYDGQLCWAYFGATVQFSIKAKTGMFDSNISERSEILQLSKPNENGMLSRYDGGSYSSSEVFAVYGTRVWNGDKANFNVSKYVAETRTRYEVVLAVARP